MNNFLSNYWVQTVGLIGWTLINVIYGYKMYKGYGWGLRFGDTDLGHLINPRKADSADKLALKIIFSVMLILSIFFWVYVILK